MRWVEISPPHYYVSMNRYCKYLTSKEGMNMILFQLRPLLWCKVDDGNYQAEIRLEASGLELLHVWFVISPPGELIKKYKVTVLDVYDKAIELGSFKSIDDAREAAQKKYEDMMNTIFVQIKKLKMK